jgi:hypothetical protein
MYFASAEEICATAEVSSINPSSVDADEDFTVGIQIDNCGTEPPENVIFEITKKSPDIIIKQPLVTNIGTLGYANSERFINYNMRTTVDATPGIHVIDGRLIYKKGDLSFTKDISFSITVISKRPEIFLSRVYSSPDFIYEADNVILTIDVENSGEGEAKDVKVELMDSAFEGAKIKYLGRIDPNENLPAKFILESPDYPGLFEASAKVTYREGSEKKTIDFPVQIQVFQEKSNYNWIIYSSIAFALIIIIILVSKINFKK